MKTKEYTYEEMIAWKEEEKKKGGVIVQTWFKHKTKPIYKYQLDIFGEMVDYEEVAE